VVIKLGTGVLTRGIGELDTERIASVCSQVAALRAAGTEVFLVSSGSVALGMGRLGLSRRPSDVVKKQACAAIGQGLLMQMWQSHFAPHGITVAQVLLTHEDLRSRDRHLAVKATLESLIAYGVVPVINENDTVSAAEIEALLRFGDNDTLSAMVASLVHAQHLFILSTAPGLIDLDGTGEIVPFVAKITPEVEAMARGTTSETAVGGMVSKLSAAKLALRAGCGAARFTSTTAPCPSSATKAAAYSLSVSPTPAASLKRATSSTSPRPTAHLSHAGKPPTPPPKYPQSPDSKAQT